MCEGYPAGGCLQMLLENSICCTFATNEHGQPNSKHDVFEPDSNIHRKLASISSIEKLAREHQSSRQMNLLTHRSYSEYIIVPEVPDWHVRRSNSCPSGRESIREHQGGKTILPDRGLRILIRKPAQPIVGMPAKTHLQE